MSSFRRGRGRAPFLVVVALALLALGLAPLASRVAAQETEAGGTIRFVHALAGGGPVDILIDGTPRVQGLEFGTATEYASFPKGEVKFQVVPTGGSADQALTDQTIDVDSGDAYNVVIGNEESDLEARVYDVDLDAIDPGQARVRVIHASPDAGDLDIRLLPQSGAEGNAIEFNGASQNDEIDYQTVPSGTYDLTANVKDDSEAALQVGGVVLEPGRVYDLVVLGRSSDQTLTMLPLITPVSRPCSELLNVGTATDACLRFIHTSPDAGAVDIYADGTRMADAVDFGAFTDFLAFPSGEHQIQIVPAGKTTDDALLDEKYDLDSAQAYQVAVIGSAADDDNGDNDLRLQENEIDLTPLPAGQARIRVTHAALGVDDVDIVAQGDNKLFDGVGFGDATDYAVVDAGAYNIDVHKGGEDEVLFSAGDVELKEGMTYDVFAVGRAEDNSLALLVLETNATERTGGQGTPTPLQPEVTETPSTDTGVTEATVVEGTSTADEQIDEAPVTPVVTPTP